MVLLCAAPVSADVSPDTVVATINGKEVTAGELAKILAGAPPEVQNNLRKSRRQFVQQYALVSFLADEGEKQNLAEESPYREQLAWSRLQLMLQAAIAHKRYEFLDAEGATEAGADEATRKWMDSMRDRATVSFENDAYFSGDPEQSKGVAPDTVVAVVNGDSFTADQVTSAVRGAGARVQEGFRNDRKQFLREYAMTLLLVEYAEENELASTSPYAEQLAWIRQNTLSQGALNAYTKTISISTQDELDYYETHRDKYTQATVKIIYVSFGTGDSVGQEIGGKIILGEEEATEKMKKIREEILAGADFVEMVREHSEDEVSKAKDGDYGTLSMSDKIPETIKDAVFSLEEGEVSEPVRQPNGLYLFRVEETGLKPLDEVRQTLRREAQGAKFSEWFESIRTSMKVTYENEEYFAEQGE